VATFTTKRNRENIFEVFLFLAWSLPTTVPNIHRMG